MKLRKLADTFLKVGRIIAIVLIAVFGVLLVVYTILDTIDIARLASNGDSVAPAVGSLVGHIIEFVLFTAFAIASLILKAEQKLFLILLWQTRSQKRRYYGNCRRCIVLWISSGKWNFNSLYKRRRLVFRSC